MLLNSFEKQIDPTILNRGKSYFKNGQVRKILEIRKDEYQMKVDGSEVYTVTIELEGGKIVQTECDCPYDFGDVCKHVVAGLFALKERKASGGQKEESKPVEEVIRAIIRNLDRETIENWVVTQSVKDEVFRNAILQMIQKKNGALSKETYVQQIRDSMESYGERYGYVDWRNASRAMSDAEDLLEEVTENIDNSEYDEAFVKISGLLEALYPALEEVDDSNGDVGSVIENTWFEFNRLSKVLPNELKREVFDYCLSSAKKEIFSGWLIESDFYEIASEMILNADMKKILIETLREYLTKKDLHGFEAEKIALIHRRILEKNGSKEELDAFLDTHIQIPEIRKGFIERALEKNDFESAKKLANEGIKIANKNKHFGTILIFQKILLDIAVQSKNEEDQKYWLLELLVLEKELKYFYQLKKIYKKDLENWLGVRTVIFQKLSEANVSSRIFYQIFEQESMWKEFSEKLENELGKKDPWDYGIDSGGLDLLDSYLSIISKNFPEKLKKWYTESARRAFREASTRNHYQSYFRFIKKLSNIPIGSEIIQEIKQELNEKYKNRKALLEEMNLLL